MFMPRACVQQDRLCSPTNQEAREPRSLRLIPRGANPRSRRERLRERRPRRSYGPDLRHTPLKGANLTGIFDKDAFHAEGSLGEVKLSGYSPPAAAANSEEQPGFPGGRKEAFQRS